MSYAAAAGRPAAVHFLLSTGANLRTIRTPNHTLLHTPQPLSYAAAAGRPAAVEYLISKGANVRVTTRDLRRNLLAEALSDSEHGNPTVARVGKEEHMAAGARARACVCGASWAGMN